MAEVNIEQINSTVRAVDGESILDARTLAQIVEADLREIERRNRTDARQQQLTRIGKDR